jgi:hypothetical protein
MLVRNGTQRAEQGQHVLSWGRNLLLSRGVTTIYMAVSRPHVSVSTQRGRKQSSDSLQWRSLCAFLSTYCFNKYKNAILPKPWRSLWSKGRPKCSMRVLARENKKTGVTKHGRSRGNNQETPDGVLPCKQDMKKKKNRSMLHRNQMSSKQNLEFVYKHLTRRTSPVQIIKQRCFISIWLKWLSSELLRL